MYCKVVYCDQNNLHYADYLSPQTQYTEHNLYTYIKNKIGDFSL